LHLLSKRTICGDCISETAGVVVFFVLLGFFGLIVHCSSFNDNQDPCLAGCRNCCYGWGILDCLPASLEACFALVLVFIVIFAILGIAYGFLATTMAVQRIWQRHYHILTKRELTKASRFLKSVSYSIRNGMKPCIFHSDTKNCIFHSDTNNSSILSIWILQSSYAFLNLGCLLCRNM
jgi:hypothetical protein